ncbi:MAG: hypothetical protein OEY68_03560 [Gammaproteobacteria bacterium]|nr:hypothetical protein [Gammaproteobacteria bacterium]
MKISQSLASIYQNQFPIRDRGANTHPAPDTASKGKDKSHSEPPERVLAGEVLRDQPSRPDEVYAKSRVYQQTLFQGSLEGPASARYAISSYEDHSRIQQEEKTGEFIDLYV